MSVDIKQEYLDMLCALPYLSAPELMGGESVVSTFVARLKCGINDVVNGGQGAEKVLFEEPLGDGRVRQLLIDFDNIGEARFAFNIAKILYSLNSNSDGRRRILPFLRLESRVVVIGDEGMKQALICALNE